MTPPHARVGLLRNLKIGAKLTIGLGILAFLTLLVVALGYLSSAQATKKINDTAEVRVPTALVSSRAQANLLRMLGDVRGYLALGELPYRTGYSRSDQAFREDVAELKALAEDRDPATEERLKKLDLALGQWSQLPEKMFQLRDDQLAREPAYNLLMTDGAKFAGNILTGIDELIAMQGGREPTPENVRQLVNMARFQGSFAAITSALRGYVTTRNAAFFAEYQASLAANDADWNNLTAGRESLTAGQQATLAGLSADREQFLNLVTRLLARLEGADWRLDLFWFKTVAVPRADGMLTLLDEITNAQQGMLQEDLNEGRTELSTARQRSLVGGAVALLLSLALALLLGNNIAGPVRRLTQVAQQIRAGDLHVQAQVESRDEVGILSQAFNEMTGQLRQTLIQVNREKKRADDLLDVVIPFGVALASERDFNRLLENMLLDARSFCRSDAGMLYLLTEDDRLEFVIVRNDMQNVNMGGAGGQPVDLPPVPLRLSGSDEPNRCSIAARAALTGESVNIADAAELAQFEMCVAESQVAASPELAATSVLAVPLKGSEGRILGVMELFNAKDPESGQIVPFDANLQRMMESFSSLAVAALESYVREQRLHQQIQQLRIEIDEAKQQKQIQEIVDTDFFQDLQAKARAVRERRSKQRDEKAERAE